MVARPVSVLFSIYALMWIVSFVDKGVVKDDLEAQSIYQKITIFAMIGTAVALPILGYIADKFGAQITMPFSFLIRAVVLTSILTIENPNTWFAYACCSLIIISSAMQHASLDTLYLRKVPQ